MYSNAKIYKLQGDDGVFYLGSTCNELRVRFSQHKKQLTTSAHHHFSEVGWDTCRIVLVEAYPCESRLQLRQREDWYIRQHQEDPMCLNIRNAVRTKEDNQAGQHENYLRSRESRCEKARLYYAANREAQRAKQHEHYLKTKSAQENK